MFSKILYSFTFIHVSDAFIQINNREGKVQHNKYGDDIIGYRNSTSKQHTDSRVVFSWGSFEKEILKVKSSHHYLFSTFYNADCVKAVLQH